MVLYKQNDLLFTQYFYCLSLLKRQFLFILELLEKKCILNGNMCLSGTKTKMNWRLFNNVSNNKLTKVLRVFCFYFSHPLLLCL